jgi:hypothetical protein
MEKGQGSGGTAGSGSVAVRGFKKSSGLIIETKVLGPGWSLSRRTAGPG